MRFVQRQDAVDRLDLDDDFVGNDDVRAIAAVEVQIIVFDWELDLARVSYGIALEFMA